MIIITFFCVNMLIFSYSRYIRQVNYNGSGCLVVLSLKTKKIAYACRAFPIFLNPWVQEFLPWNPIGIFLSTCEPNPMHA